MSENSLVAILAGTVGVVMVVLILGAVQCSRRTDEAFIECVKTTQDPLECHAALPR